MKKLVPLLFLLFLANGQAQSIVWIDSMEVADGIYGYIRPRMTLSKNGDPQVLLSKSGSGKLFFSQWNGVAFTTPFQLTDSLDETYIANWTGPDMESHGDTIVAVFKLEPYETGNIYAVRSTDGGQTFGAKQQVDSHTGGMVWMPSMNMDGAGNPILTYMAHDVNYTNPHYVIVRSNDGGVSYENEEFVTGGIPGEACDCCPSEIATQGNKKVLLFRNNENNVRDIYAVVTDASGSTFSYSENVDGNAWSLQSCPSTGPHAIIVDSIMYTTFVTGVSGAYRVHVSLTSLSDSAVYLNSYDLPAPTSAFGIQNFPRIAIENGLFVIAWTEAESSNFDVYTSWAPLADLGQLQNHKQRVNFATGGVQTNPDLRIHKGVIHLVYQDNLEAATIYKKGLIGYAGLDEVNMLKNQWTPNPATANTNVKISSYFKNKDFSIVDMNGRLVYQHDQKSDQIPGLKSGIYLVRVVGSPAFKWTVN